MILSQIKKHKNYYLLVFDQAESIRVSEDSIVKHHLIVGKNISEELIHQLTQEYQFDQLLRKAIKYASNYKSNQEMIDYLANLTTPSITDEIMTTLINLKLVSDEKIIRYYFTKNYSYQMLLAKLSLRQVDQRKYQDLITTYDETNALEIQLQQLKKRNYPPEKIMMRLFALGFNQELIENIDTD